MSTETELAKLGGPLLAPSVQELAKEPLPKLPPRFVRTDEDPPFVSHTNLSAQVPVIDMQKLSSQEERDRLHRACKGWGFFQLINHGVSTSLVEKMKIQVQEIFNLPMEEKKKLWQRPDEIEGFGQGFLFSEEQKINWGDRFYMTTLPTYLRKPHLFSNLPLSFRETLEAYSLELRNLAMKLLELMAKALGMDPDDMRVLFEEGQQSMRMNYYPPCPQPELAIGLKSHSDTLGLTILLQLNEVEGLQIRKNGVWVPIKPLPNAFVINIGDIIEIVSNGIYPSIEHRATVNSVKERVSVATFYGPKLEGEVGPAPSLITPRTPPRFRRIGAVDYFKGFLSREIRRKSYLDTLRLNLKE
ncbi:Thebaine 6-O-demethylase [Hibiscus syriacus]|uniref:Thebaine 6-O-demethylase n=1 Tax=Hibiscus syriacus TaxID=106335 RepID=A0A6A3CBW1_HIBSY|nr:protein SRG1-like [Hibiscus syriacus]XP_039057893.1 protein SRG1-like [Hibiscus syriacus]XP_039057895.1 protein SRG1-like [Hibiscus syriacus]KAE8726236.1 Thebaine 6-O-demethylase [Hibiscus syriacus]